VIHTPCHGRLVVLYSVGVPVGDVSSLNIPRSDICYRLEDLGMWKLGRCRS
jgi:hypothetical protein